MTMNPKMLWGLMAGALFACGDAQKQPPSYQALVAETIPKIESQLGLTFKTPPVVEARTKEQLRAFLQAQLEDSVTRAELAGSEIAGKLFGMFPDTLNVEQLMINLLTEQIVGYYDPKTKVLYVMEGAPANAVTMTVTHELVHALQDQYLNLDSIQQLRTDSDRKLALQAVLEGQAMHEQFLASGTAINMAGGWERMRTVIRNSQTGMPVFASAPFAVQEALLFPYLNGIEFVRNHHSRTGGTVSFSDLPQSTEQILRPDKFYGRRDQPLTVQFAPISGVTPTHSDNMGEFGIRILLYDRLRVADAIHGASGWGGDRYIVFTSNGKSALAWATVWDTPADAHLFENLMQRYKSIMDRLRPGRTRTLTTEMLDGHATVLWVDVPEGADPGVVPFSAVRIMAGAK